MSSIVFPLFFHSNKLFLICCLMAVGFGGGDFLSMSIPCVPYRLSLPLPHVYNCYRFFYFCFLPTKFCSLLLFYLFSLDIELALPLSVVGFFFPLVWLPLPVVLPSCRRCLSSLGVTIPRGLV